MKEWEKRALVHARPDRRNIGKCFWFACSTDDLILYPQTCARTSTRTHTNKHAYTSPPTHTQSYTHTHTMAPTHTHTCVSYLIRFVLHIVILLYSVYGLFHAMGYRLPNAKNPVFNLPWSLCDCKYCQCFTGCLRIVLSVVLFFLLFSCTSVWSHCHRFTERTLSLLQISRALVAIYNRVPNQTLLGYSAVEDVPEWWRTISSARGPEGLG